MKTAEIALVISFGTLFVNTAIALFVHRHTRSAAKVQLSQQVQEQWREIDQATRSDEESLAIVERFSSEDPKQIPLNARARRRKSELASLYLNQFATLFFGIENHLFKASLTPILEETLKRFMRDDDIFEVVQKGIYDPKFVALCRKCRPRDGDKLRDERSRGFWCRLLTRKRSALCSCVSA